MNSMSFKIVAYKFVQIPVSEGFAVISFMGLPLEPAKDRLGPFGLHPMGESLLHTRCLRPGSRL